ncbi:MAG: hypothetical protein Q9209_006139 [Squamulea sp. 1 TL-2023]
MDLTRHFSKPTYEFFIPSIHDDTALACRIYSVPEAYFGGRKTPEEEKPPSPQERPWTPRAAVVAHPCFGYWGSYDSPVVMEVVRELMKAGFTVGTFNFRGSGTSEGKRTADGKAELQDYISFVGFMMYYIHGVYPPVPGGERFDKSFPLTRILSGVPAARPPAYLVLAGYSYGALLTRHLPHIPVVLGRFSKVLKTSTQAEIRSRACVLASVTIIDILDCDMPSAHESRKSKIKQLDNKNRATERKTHMDLLQKPFVRKEAKDSWPDREFGPFDEDYTTRVEVPTPRTNYVLISMPFGRVASIITGFKKLEDVDVEKYDNKFQYSPTAVIHGRSDLVTSETRMFRWVEDVAVNSHDKCMVVGVDGAGHLWRETRAMDKLRARLREWFHRHFPIGQDYACEGCSSLKNSAEQYEHENALTEDREKRVPVKGGLNTKENNPKAEASSSNSAGNRMSKISTMSDKSGLT